MEGRHLYHRQAHRVGSHESVGASVISRHTRSKPGVRCKIHGRKKVRTRRSSEREPAVSLRDKSNIIGGWLPSLTFSLGRRTITVQNHNSKNQLMKIKLFIAVISTVAGHVLGAVVDFESLPEGPVSGGAVTFTID